MIDIQYYILCLVLLFLSTLLLKPLFKKPSKTRLPPSPPALPLIGHLHLIGPYIYKSLHKLSTKYGPLHYLCLGASRCLVVSTSSLATEIFKTHDLAFASRPHFILVDKLPYQNYGLFMAPFGDYWRFIRKLCIMELLSAQKLMKLTNNTACMMLMSMRCSDECDEAVTIMKLVKEFVKILGKVWIGNVLGPLRILAFWLYGRHAINVTLRYDEILERVLKQHEENPKIDNEDFMDILLKVHQDDTTEFKITRTHLKAILLVSHICVSA
ncbi:cytochrome P450 705A12-like [Fagus crenata]